MTTIDTEYEKVVIVEIEEYKNDQDFSKNCYNSAMLTVIVILSIIFFMLTIFCVMAALVAIERNPLHCANKTISIADN